MSLLKDKYPSKEAAIARWDAIRQTQRLVQVGDGFETAAYYCWRVK